MLIIFDFSDVMLGVLVIDVGLVIFIKVWEMLEGIVVLVLYMVVDFDGFDFFGIYLGVVLFLCGLYLMMYVNQLWMIC